MNIYLITIDAWRASHASFLPGSEDGLTPNMASLSPESCVFTEAISHGPATPYAFPSLFSSTLPLDICVYEPIAPNLRLLIESLAAAGVTSIAVHANPWLGEKYGYARGYSSYQDVGEFSLPLFDTVREILIDRFGLDHWVYRIAQRVYRRFQGPLTHLGGDDEVEAVLDRLAAASTTDSNTFLWVHLLTPHAPYTPPKRHREAVGLTEMAEEPFKLVTRAQQGPHGLSSKERSIVRRLYAGAVRHADERVGRLLEVVEDDSLIIITADHGEALFEHGQVGHEPSLYDELLHVPLLIRPPSGHRNRGIVDSQVRHIDIAPTILDYAGIDRLKKHRGRTLKPAIEGRGIEDRIALSEVASTSEQPGRVDPSALQISVRTPGRKLIHRDDRTIGFDLHADPREKQPLREFSGAQWDPLTEILTDRLEEIDFTTAHHTDRDTQAKKRLKELGYID